MTRRKRFELPQTGSKARLVRRGHRLGVARKDLEEAKSPSHRPGAMAFRRVYAANILTVPRLEWATAPAQDH
jgi:hypothetical protein